MWELCSRAFPLHYTPGYTIQKHLTLLFHIPLYHGCLSLTIPPSAWLTESFGPDVCCFSYYSKRLPKNNVVAFQRTGTHCPKDGVVWVLHHIVLTIVLDHTVYTWILMWMIARGRIGMVNKILYWPRISILCFVLYSKIYGKPYYSLIIYYF